jgi:hypothetical protein
MKRWMLATLALFAITGSVSAQVLTYSATTTGGPTWNRPDEGVPPTSLSGTGTATPFHAQPFYVTVGGNYSFQSTATSPVSWDNYLFLYSPDFNPTNPLANALIGNDDFPLPGDIGVSGFTFSLVPNTQYFLINTGFDNNEEGDFTVDVSDIPGGSDGIFLGTLAVPEPTTIALVTSVALGLVGYRYRSKFQGKMRLSTARR